MKQKVVEAKIKNINYLKKVIDKINKVSQKCSLKFINRGALTYFRIDAINENMDISICFFLKDKYFEYMNCNEAEIQIGINTKDFYDILNKINDEPLIFYILNNDRNVLIVKTLTDEFKLQNIQHKTIFNYDISFYKSRFLCYELLNKMCNDINKNYEFVKITINDKDFTFCGCEYQNINNKVIEQNILEHLNKKNHIPNTITISNIYKLKDLLLINQFNKLNKKTLNRISLYFKQDFPLFAAINQGLDDGLRISIKHVDVFKQNPKSLFEICFYKLFKNSCQAEINETLSELFTDLPISINKINFSKLKQYLPYLSEIKKI